ncbi:hypothetical protein PVK06_033403 [Gossypium arboreum]|uniref:Secreted protein n=1 Tax=Gossypium arboreum TaxID=29729 RepID=A0ABR0NDF7_GOSAR|nr:hypothetical protein PVK06_033403 [Gossypium arboreum]
MVGFLHHCSVSALASLFWLLFRGFEMDISVVRVEILMARDVTLVPLTENCIVENTTCFCLSHNLVLYEMDAIDNGCLCSMHAAGLVTQHFFSSQDTCPKL